MGKKTEDKIDIDKLDFEELVELRKVCEKDHDRCKKLACSDCKLTCRNFVGVYWSCNAVRGHISKHITDFAIEHFDQQKATGDCQSCEHLRKACGFLFCNFWHNFTIKDGYCHGFADMK